MILTETQNHLQGTT